MIRACLLPLQPAPLLLVAIFSLLLALGLQTLPLGLPILLIIGSWFFKYGFMLLDHVAHGRPDAPVLTVEAANPLGEKRPLAYALALLVCYFATGLLQSLLGAAAVSMLRHLGLVLLPAVIAVHAVTGSFAAALQPRAVATMIARLGWGYVLVVGVAVGAGLLGREIVFEGSQLSLVLRLALLMLLWLALFAVLGAVLHARRLEVGFEPEHSPERTRRRAERERDHARDRLIDQVFAEFRAGRLQTAWQSVERHARQSATPADEFAWILERAAAWDNPRLANRIAQALLPLLLAARRNGEALQVARSRLHADPGFRPVTSDQLLTLAELARDGGNRPLGRALLADFDRFYPDDPQRQRAGRLRDQLARQ